MQRIIDSDASVRENLSKPLSLRVKRSHVNSERLTSEADDLEKNLDEDTDVEGTITPLELAVGFRAWSVVATLVAEEVEDRANEVSIRKEAWDPG